MLFNDIYCLIVKGGFLTDEMRNELFDEAQEMLKIGRKKRKIKSHEMEGEIRTRFKISCLFGFAGIIFYALIETDKGIIKIDYVIRPTDHRTWQTCGKWITSSEDLSSCGDPNLN